jgi:hypothetical protein
VDDFARDEVFEDLYELEDEDLGDWGMYSGDVGWQWVVPADVLGEGLWDVLQDHVEFAALFFRLLMYPQQPTS